jgi:hypothetical protein
VAGSRHVTVLEVEAYGTAQTVLLGAVLSRVPTRPDARLSFIYKWEAAGWGE